MKFFKKFFGSKKTSDANSDTSRTHVEDVFRMIDEGQLPDMDKDLFVEQEYQPKPQPRDPEVRSKILQFLNGEHFDKGYSDGFQFHSEKVLKTYIGRLKVTFEELVEAEKERLYDMRVQLEIDKYSIGLLDESMVHMVDSRLCSITIQEEKLDKYLRELQQEEGLGAKPILAYRDGFLRGLQTYMEERGRKDNETLFN